MRSPAILIVATFRAEHIQREHLLSGLPPRLQHDCPRHSLRIGNFSVCETQQLIESSGGPSNPYFAMYLQTRSDGNPFYVLEFPGDLQAQLLLPKDMQGVPESADPRCRGSRACSSRSSLNAWRVFVRTSRRSLQPRR